MKMILAFIGLIVFLTGCDSPRPISYTYTPHIKTVYIYGTYSPNEDEASEITNLAIFLRKAAEIFKRHKIKYFYIENQDIPKVLNNFSSLVAYCYPDNDGYDPSEFGEKSTNLERKCDSVHALKTNGTTYYHDENNLVIALKGATKRRIDVPFWSVEKVLHSKEIQKYIDNGVEDAGDRKIEFIEGVDGSTRYEMSLIYRKEYMKSLF